jgi:hypothetical protein
MLTNQGTTPEFLKNRPLMHDLEVVLLGRVFWQGRDDWGFL